MKDATCEPLQCLQSESGMSELFRGGTPTLAQSERRVQPENVCSGRQCQALCLVPRPQKRKQYGAAYITALGMGECVCGALVQVRGPDAEPLRRHADEVVGC